MSRALLRFMSFRWTVGLAALGAACSGGDSELDEPTAVVRTDLPTVGNAWVAQPPFATTRDVEMRQFLANQTLLTRCLQDRGFDYQPIPYEDEWRYVDLVSPLDRGYAESQGYHLPQIVPHDPNTALYDTPAFDAVYEECGLAANARAFRVADRFAELSSTAAADLRARLEQFASGSEGVMVLEAWAECLNEKGYEYATPQDAQLKFVEAPEVTPEEIRVRLADLECDEQVGYTRTRYEWESSNADAWFAQNEAQVALLTAEAESVVDSLVELEAELAANSGGG